MYIIKNIGKVCNNLHDWVSGLDATYTTPMYEVFSFRVFGKGFWVGVNFLTGVLGDGNFVVSTFFLISNDCTLVSSQADKLSVFD